MTITTVDDRGRVAIPKEIREKYKPSKVLFIDMGKHVIMLTLPGDPIAALNGISGDVKQSIKEMKIEASQSALTRRSGTNG